MIHRLSLAGLLSICALSSCTQNPYDTNLYGPEPRTGPRQPAAPGQPYGLYNQPAQPDGSLGQPYGTQPYGTQPYGTQPYGTQPPTTTENPPVPPYNPNGLTNPTPAPAPQPRSVNDYPVAERTDNPDIVMSPYFPGKRVSVKGFKSGQLVKDPNNKDLGVKMIFRVP